MSETAATIIAALGGAHRLRAMIGASILYSEDGVKVMFKGSRKYNTLLIDYHRGTDTFTVSFGRFSKKNLTHDILARFDMVHVGELAPLFERQTGLYLSL